MVDLEPALKFLLGLPAAELGEEASLAVRPVLGGQLDLESVPRTTHGADPFREVGQPRAVALPAGVARSLLL